MYRTVLVVDDTPTNLSVLFDVLNEEGYRVLVAESGEAAMRCLQRSQPDAILLDLMMPGMDGFETMAAIRQEEAYSGIPILFMTAVHEIESKVRALSAGAVDYITKPFQQEEVLARLETHIMLRDLRKALEHEIFEKDELIKDLEAYSHTVAHDLKSPLAGVMSACELLTLRDGDSLSESSAKMLEMINRSCSKMNAIIRELLLLASIRKQDAPRTKVEPLQVVAEAWSRLTTLADSRRAELCLPETIPSVLGYAPWLEEVLANLLSNAIKYGGEPPVITVEVSEPKPGFVQIGVRDNGRGLSAEEQQAVLQPFTQLEPTRAEGHGLGLPIVHRIVQKLGGEFGCESEPGRGSLFYLRLAAADQPTEECRGTLAEAYPQPVRENS